MSRDAPWGLPIKSQLTVQVLLWVIGISLLMFSAVSVLTVLHDRNRMYQAARQDARGNVARSMPAISTGLWNFDTDALNANLQALTQSGSIVRAEVWDPRQRIAATARVGADEPDFVSAVPIIGPDGLRKIGTLKIAESYRDVREASARFLATGLLSELAKIAGLAALLFLVIYRLITRHLQSLAQQVSNLRTAGDFAPVSLQHHRRRHDELGTLVEAINRFRSERVEAEGALRRDIAERKRVEAALSKSEIALSEALQIAELAYWEYDGADREFILNDQYYRLHRTSASDVGGYRIQADDFFRRLVHAEDASTFATYIQEALQPTRADRLRQIEIRILCADGGNRWIVVRCKPEQNTNGKFARLIGASQNITERKHAEEMLRSTQSELARVIQLSTMGQMAASIAHEINQPLGAVVTNASAGLRWLTRQTPDLEEVRAVLKQSSQMGSARAR